MRPIRIAIFILSVIILYPFTQTKAETQKRAMSFLDIIEMRRYRRGDISPDGKWFIYIIPAPNWERNKRFEDIYITPLSGGKTKQMTFTKDRNERFPKWFNDSSLFAFLSDDSENKTQIFFMHRDGSEAWKITHDRFGVSSYKWSKDWKYLAYLDRNPDQRQIWIMPGEGGDANKLTDHKTPISSFVWNPDSRKVYFIAPDSVDLLDKDRKEKGFDVVIQDEIEFPSHLWEIDIETRKERRLTGGNEYSVSAIVISDDGKRIAFNGASTKRYATYRDTDIYLIDLNTNTISRITNNSVDEWYLSFSPDSKWFAFTMPDGEKLNLRKVYVISSEGGKAKKLLTNFDYEPWIDFWSDDSKYIYFNTQVGVDYRLFRVSFDDEQIEQITNFSGSVSYFRKDKTSGKCVVDYSDPANSFDCYYSEPDNFPNRDKWIKLTDVNPQVKDFLLGKYETIRWKSTDDTVVEGLLIKPINYDEDRRYPLIVQIHGGPHDAYDNRFNDYVHIYAANDYVVFQPNYRGSTGYGERFLKEVTPYFGLSLNDIMTGVDYLIERGIVHPDSMGVMGWSAGGSYSNSMLVSTDRFKAISTGAGTLYSDKMDNYNKESPLKYIKNAKTPTLIHFGEDDQLMPLRHGQVLYKALKELGVPTEFIVYPNTGHGIWNMRYQLVKMHAEFNWFEKWIRGREGWIDWKEMLETLEEE
jgi:dipeptidyl aminopeptidase/acylaminoacyl peptidase